MDDVDLRQPALYLNRELSLLAFNRRVLEQARDANLPPLERLRFLCISSTNLDEFFEIRVAGLKQRLEYEGPAATADGVPLPELLRSISTVTRELVRHQYDTLNETIIPLLANHGIRFLRREEWSREQKRWLRRYFEQELVPLLTPIGLDPAHPFPRIINKSLNFIVRLEGRDAFGRDGSLAVVPAPRSLPRLIQLPPAVAGNGPHDFVFLSSVIHAYVADLFPGMHATGCWQFRVTRNSDLYVDEEDVEDLLRAVEGELHARRYGEAVRLEVAHDCPDDIIAFLLEHFELENDDLFRVNGPVNLNRLLEVYERVDRPELKFTPFVPGNPRAFTPGNIFEFLAAHDVLLHHPFESFQPVVEFVRQAATDPQVLAIKQTLYRSGSDSAIVDALVAAARAGKEVTAVIELRARFDEAANIALANRLQQAGAHVAYGVVGHKTHAKMILVVRREGRRLRRYVHLATGNYHPQTARHYTDYGLFTSDAIIGEDVHKIFLQLTGLGRVRRLKRLLQSPFTLHKGILERIAREAEHARAGKPGRITAKVNALVEPETIRALYRASQAGVKIDLVVRGMCCLRPGIAGVSDNIRVRSIVGRFLEHARVYHFHNAGESEVLLASADWMERNFQRRVEIAFPVEDKRLRARILHELQHYLRDNTQAWELLPSGEYRRLTPGSAKPHSAQAALLTELAERPALG
ncbi:MAG TPA: polyphosphate kinase 1 [Gammaproteobacteria bacterium]|nr:polyphosphate kinase 1 [Gammaproteobacteria bacterium]